MALAIYCLLPPLSFWAWGVLLVGMFFVGVYTSRAGEKAWGKDPGYVVIDEFVGFFVTVSLLPQSVLMGVVGFVVFRVLDIVKPPPARQAEALLSIAATEFLGMGCTAGWNVFCRGLYISGR